MSDDRAAIETAVKTYLDGLFEGDVEKLASVFHPSSSLTWEEDGVLTPLHRDAWLDGIRGRASARARALERHDEILQIDQASPTTAFVKLKCQIPPRYFTDYLCFLKVEGRWQVAQKVFSIKLQFAAFGLVIIVLVGETHSSSSATGIFESSETCAIASLRVCGSVIQRRMRMLSSRKSTNAARFFPRQIPPSLRT